MSLGKKKVKRNHVGGQKRRTSRDGWAVMIRLYCKNKVMAQSHLPPMWQYSGDGTASIVSYYRGALTAGDFLKVTPSCWYGSSWICDSSVAGISLCCSAKADQVWEVGWDLHAPLQPILSLQSLICPLLCPSPSCSTDSLVLPCFTMLIDVINYMHFIHRCEKEVDVCQ